MRGVGGTQFSSGRDVNSASARHYFLGWLRPPVRRFESLGFRQHPRLRPSNDTSDIFGGSVSSYDSDGTLVGT